MPLSQLVTPTAGGTAAASSGSNHLKTGSQNMKTPTKIQNFMNTYNAMGSTIQPSSNHSTLIQNKDLASLNTSYNGMSNQESGTIPGMKIVRGPFNMNCLTSREPQTVLREMSQSLEANRVSYKKMGTYGLRCQKNNVRFDMEIVHFEGLDNIFIVKFKRLAGELPQFKEVSGKVLATMNLSSSGGIN
jgi:hypothetical protein